MFLINVYDFGHFIHSFFAYFVQYGIVHRESKKTRHQTLAHNFTKYWPIFKILSLLDSVGNL